MQSGRGVGMAVAVLFAPRVHRRKNLGVANNGSKVTSWWNQKVKDAIRVKKVAYKAWLQKIAESSLHSRYAVARKSAALTLKTPKM